MTERYSKIEEIVVPSYALGSTFASTIFEILSRKKNTSCKRYGTVVDVIALDEIIDSRISAANSKNYVTVRYTFDAIKPKKDGILTAKVNSIFKEGMFLTCDAIKIIVTDGTFIPHKSGNRYRCQDCFTEFTTTTDVHLIIVDVEFKDERFYCVGKHCHNDA